MKTTTDYHERRELNMILAGIKVTDTRLVRDAIDSPGVRRSHIFSTM